ncbi:MAG: ABC transporter substrate-binding protein [Acidimicrobiales bacterium]
MLEQHHATLGQRKGRASSTDRSRVRRRVAVFTTAVVFAVTFAACGSSGGSSAGAGSSSSSPSGATLTYALVEAFTGNTSIDGIAAAAGCYPGARVINESGGVLGHKVQCTQVDTRGDPSDAIPAVQKLLATTSNLVGVLGPESSTASSLVPILNQAHIPMVSQDGLAQFDKNTNPYFWRNYPADDVGGVALAYWATHMGLKKGALFFDNSVAAQGSVPKLLSTYKHLGGTVVTNLSVAPDSTSYGSEVHQLLQAKPQVVFTESDPQTDATAFANLASQGTLMPIYGTNATVIPAWLNAVTKAIGPSKMAKYYRGVEPYAPTFPGTKAFNKALLASPQVTTPKTWIGQEYATTPYDATIILALAMTEANSTNPTVFNKDIMKVTAPGNGKTVVYSYSSGVAALKAGKQIQYIGASGPTIFNKYHNAAGEYGVYQYVNAKLKLVGIITAAELASATQG